MKQAEQITHPAPFSLNIIDLIRCKRLLPERGIVLDPMAGIGGVHALATDTLKTYGIEIEPEWAAAHPDTMVGDATSLPFGPHSFDAVVTSPTYGNRYADHHDARDTSYRRSYTHDLRQVTGDSERQLASRNTGRYYAWQPSYATLHRRAWAEVRRVLVPGGVFVLNVSDFVRRGQVVDVVGMHTEICFDLGFVFVERFNVRTPRMRFGANSEARVAAEAVLVFGKRKAA
jgi:tRNA G10  N-methylase Trm11